MVSEVFLTCNETGSNAYFSGWWIGYRYSMSLTSEERKKKNSKHFVPKPLTLYGIIEDIHKEKHTYIETPFVN